MPKSRKNKCSNIHTNHGLIKWYETEFEKLGWMVLAKNHGMQDKVDMYKKSLQRLHDNLCCKIEAVKETDRKDDLRIMKDNVVHLIEFSKNL